MSILLRDANEPSYFTYGIKSDLSSMSNLGLLVENMKNSDH